MQFMERSKKICHFADVFGSKYENERLFLFENIVSSKYSSGFIQRKFGHHTNFFCRKSRKCLKCLIQFREAWKKLQFLKKNPFFPKRSSRLIESSFDKRSEMFLLKVRKWQNSSSNLRKHFLRMSFFWSIMQFREHSRKNLPFSERFCLKVWKRRNFFKKNIVLKMFPWALPTALRPPYQFFLPKVQEMIDPNPKNMENRFFEKKSFFSQNDPQRSKKAVLTNAPNCFCQKSEIDKIGTRMSGKISEKFLWSRKLQFIERSKNNCLFRPCLAQSMKKKIFF